MENVRNRVNGKGDLEQKPKFLNQVSKKVPFWMKI